MFKVGDIVKKKKGFTSVGSMGDAEYGGQGYDKFPEVFQIEVISENPRYKKTQGEQVIFSKLKIPGIFSIALEKASYKDISKFKRKQKRKNK